MAANLFLIDRMIYLLLLLILTVNGMSFNNIHKPIVLQDESTTDTTATEEEVPEEEEKPDLSNDTNVLGYPF